MYLKCVNWSPWKSAQTSSSSRCALVYIYQSKVGLRVNPQPVASWNTSDNKFMFISSGAGRPQGGHLRGGGAARLLAEQSRLLVLRRLLRNRARGKVSTLSCIYLSICLSIYLSMYSHIYCKAPRWAISTARASTAST